MSNGWKLIVVLLIVAAVLSVIYAERDFREIRDLQRRVGQLESERR